MTISRRLRFLLTASITGLSSAAAPAQVPTFSLKAVKRNPTCTAGLVGEVCGGDRQCDTGPLTFDGQCGGEITPTNTVSAEPGDIIVAEIYGSNWSPDGQRLRSFQATIDPRGFTGGCGTALPYGWDAPPADVWCETDAKCPAGMWCDIDRQKCKAMACESDTDCPPEYPVCQPNQLCTGADHNPAKGAFTDEFRLDERDWVFEGCGALGPPFPTVFPYRYGWLLDANSLNCASTYTVEKYFGTLMLVMPEVAGGTYTIPLKPPPDSVMVDRNAQLIEPLEVENLTIEIPKSCECILADPAPGNCAVDARQVSGPNGLPVHGRDSIELNFYARCACDLTWADFLIRQVPADSPAVSIADLECKDPHKLVLTFDGPIPTQAWTCVRRLFSGKEVCVGRLPGDVDGNRVSDAADVLHLIDCLNGVASCEMYQCDIDRSGRCGPADILREIDLLNGAAAYEPWLGRALPDCLSLP